MAFPISASLLDACVLAALSRGDAYGYSLTQQIKQTIDVPESTLYPVLRRLQKEKFLATYDQPMDGRNRRYYKITVEGQERLTLYLQEWDDYKKAIESILLGEVLGDDE